jgi:hypothetical protein
MVATGITRFSFGDSAWHLGEMGSVMRRKKCWSNVITGVQAASEVDNLTNNLILTSWPTFLL